MFEVGKKYRYGNLKDVSECLCIGKYYSFFTRGTGDEYLIKNTAFHVYEEIKPKPDTIDWSHVSEKFNYMARDANESAYLYSNKPMHSNDHWSTMDGLFIIASVFASYKRGEVDWKDSLVERPEE